MCTNSQKLAFQISPTQPVDEKQLRYYGKAESDLAKLLQRPKGEKLRSEFIEIWKFGLWQIFQSKNLSRIG